MAALSGSVQLIGHRHACRSMGFQPILFGTLFGGFNLTVVRRCVRGLDGCWLGWQRGRGKDARSVNRRDGGATRSRLFRRELLDVGL